MSNAELTVSMLGDINEHVRARAIRALPTIAPPELATEAAGLANKLSHGDEDVREAVVTALGWCGDEVVNQYASGVIRCLADPKLRVRDAAVRTLLQLRPGLRALHVPPVKDLYENGEWFARSAAAVVLNSFSAEAAGVPSPVAEAAASCASSSSSNGATKSTSRTFGYVAELASLAEVYEPDPYSHHGLRERQRALDSVKKQLFPVVEADGKNQLPFVVRMGKRLLQPSTVANEDELPWAPKVTHAPNAGGASKASFPQKAAAGANAEWYTSEDRAAANLELVRFRARQLQAAADIRMQRDSSAVISNPTGAAPPGASNGDKSWLGQLSQRMFGTATGSSSSWTDGISHLAGSWSQRALSSVQQFQMFVSSNRTTAEDALSA